MKLLKDILYRTPLLNTTGSTNVAVQKICFDSREVTKESLFVAVPGTQVDGHDYIDAAIKAGARSVICEREPDQKDPKVTYVQVKNSARALAIVASNFYDNPSESLSLVGVTGTNGKTTVATLLYELFTALGYPSGLLSTVEVKVKRQSFPATHTTPNPVHLQAHLREMVNQGVKYCFMEASSHGIAQERTAGLDFNAALFTNLSHDHLDYHGTFENYLKAKKRLFDELPRKAFALSNIDERHGETMLQDTKALRHFYGLKNDAEFKAKVLEEQLTGMLLRIGHQEIWTKLIGHFNAYNLLTIYATAVLLGQDELQVATALSTLKPVNGRFQHFRSKEGVVAIVDYAHTPDALENVLKTIGRLRKGTEKVITVVGCGGNRDKTKRPEMAKIAASLSDNAIFTSDNPRNEDPGQIIKDMQDGLEITDRPKVISIVDRREAIKTALTLAQKDDIVLIAGKGHEKYQIIGDERRPFDDLAIAQEILNAKPA